MIRLEDIRTGRSLTGLEPGMIVTVIAAVPIGTGPAQVIYKLPDGTIRERLVGSADIHTLAIATTERPWSFDGDGEAFKLAVEAKRIDLAFLFDPMMAVHTSNVEPLPHQITAVYQSMLPRQPLRFVLADDPGAGKTIMAGLYIRELIMRADSRRILVVAPGSLVEQWRDADGRQRKMILFTEHKDTLNYLERRIGGVLGTPDAITTIHGSVHRDERRKRQALFRSDPEVRILLATDAAGEGVNLQNANLMVNYDLPWNPNRLEQRFGRIHRIGQDQVCHLWNLVAKETREGEVYHRLLTKLETINDAFNGRVFDILGEVFEERSLKDLLLDAIRYNDQPERRDSRLQSIDNALDVTHIKDLLDRNALAQETMSAERLFAVKEQMEIAEARRLQPYFVRSFFAKAFEGVGGAMYPREPGRFEITHVPALIRERDRQITGRNRRELAPVLKRYERVCFTKEAVRRAEEARGCRVVDVSAQKCGWDLTS